MRCPNSGPLSTFLSLTDLEDVARSFAALGHVTRLEILLSLRKGDKSPTQVAEELPGQTLGRVAHHFRALATAGLIVETHTRPKRGAIEHFYVLATEALDLLDKLDLVEADRREN